MSIQENIMRPSSILIALFILFLVMPAQALAVELTIHNAEQCGAKVALAYSRDGLQVVEGWYRLEPGQARVIELFQVNVGDVYASVVFEYPSIEQYMEKDSPLVEHSVQDVNLDIQKDRKTSRRYAKPYSTALHRKRHCLPGKKITGTSRSGSKTQPQTSKRKVQ